MARPRFVELRVYRLAEELADQIWEIVRKWPALARSTVGEQLVKSADSIGANLAEGVGKGGIKENRRFVFIARGSLYETHHWLRRASRRNLLSRHDQETIRHLLDNLTPQLNAYITSLSSRIKT